MIGREIIARRKRMGLTQRELARLINVKPTTICQYEAGMRKIPFEVLANVAVVLKCSAIDLAYEELGVADPAEKISETAETLKTEKEASELNFVDPLDVEIVKSLKDLDKIAKEKVITYIRDQKVISRYYQVIRERKEQGEF